MKQLTLNIPEKNYPFFIELVKRLDFITLNEPKKKKEAIQKHPVLESIEQGLKEVELAKKGKLKATPLNEFLNEI
jgi:hypothetical protein